MTEDQRLAIIIGSLWGMLYAAGCFVAGIVTAHSFSWQMALFTMAACYGATLIQVEGIAPVLARGAVLVTILFGAISGLSLLV